MGDGYFKTGNYQKRMELINPFQLALMATLNVVGYFLKKLILAQKTPGRNLGQFGGKVVGIKSK